MCKLFFFWHCSSGSTLHPVCVCSSPLFAVSVTAASRDSLVTLPFGLPYSPVVSARWCTLINLPVHLARGKYSFSKTWLCYRFFTYLLVRMGLMPLKGIQLMYARLNLKVLFVRSGPLRRNSMFLMLINNSFLTENFKSQHLEFPDVTLWYSILERGTLK